MRVRARQRIDRGGRPRRQDRGLIAGAVFGFAGQLVVDKRTRPICRAIGGVMFQDGTALAVVRRTLAVAPRRSGDARDWDDDRCVCRCRGT
jgi:hypothetical protein